jgi:xanthine dehydrogenase accessory factor
MESLYRIAAEMEEKGEPGVFCSVIKTQGSVPRHAGSKMIVLPDGKIIGSVGGGGVESRVVEEALQIMSDGKARVIDYKMVDPKAGDPGICGGQLEIVLEPLHPRPVILVVGGGHVGKALVHLAKWMGWRVLLSDDRPEFCNPAAVPDAEEYFPCQIDQLPNEVKINQNTYVVLTTRGLDVDVQGLPALLETPAAYIGVIGSKRRWLTARKKLVENGYSEEKLHRVYSPIGLELKAETPEEIAVSIMAELLMYHNKASGESMTMIYKKMASE